ncbi:MAG: MFS transporter [Succinivibrio sp.]|nr:MFS transporter [Succinivibrio sp.]
MNLRQLTLIVLTLNMLLLSSSNTLVMPFLPLYLQDELNCPDDYLSIYTATAYSITFIVSMFASPVWGKFADIYGKKTMLVRVSVILCISYLCCYLSTNAIELCLSRALQGLASGMTPAFLGLVSELQSSNKTGKAMGFIQSANLTGTIIGPVIGGVISEITGVRECFFIVMVVTAITSLLNIFVVKEPQVKKEETEDQTATADNSFTPLLKDPVIQSLSCCIFINAMSIMMVVPMLSTYVISLTEYKDPIVMSGLVFALSGIAGAIASPLWGSYGNKYSYLNILAVSSLGAAITYLVQTFVKDISIFALLQFSFGLCICAIAPAVHSITAKHVASKNKTKAYSLIYSSQQLGNLSGPIICAVITNVFAQQYVFLCIAAMLGSLSLYLVAIKFVREHKEN